MQELGISQQTNLDQRPAEKPGYLLLAKPKITMYYNMLEGVDPAHNNRLKSSEIRDTYISLRKRAVQAMYTSLVSNTQVPSLVELQKVEAIAAYKLSNWYNEEMGEHVPLNLIFGLQWIEDSLAMVGDSTTDKKKARNKVSNFATIFRNLYRSTEDYKTGFAERNIPETLKADVNEALDDPVTGWKMLHRLENEKSLYYTVMFLKQNFVDIQRYQYLWGDIDSYITRYIEFTNNRIERLSYSLDDFFTEFLKRMPRYRANAKELVTKDFENSSWKESLKGVDFDDELIAKLIVLAPLQRIRYIGEFCLGYTPRQIVLEFSDQQLGSQALGRNIDERLSQTNWELIQDTFKLSDLLKPADGPRDSLLTKFISGDNMLGIDDLKIVLANIRNYGEMYDELVNFLNTQFKEIDPARILQGVESLTVKLLTQIQRGKLGEGMWIGRFKQKMEREIYNISPISSTGGYYEALPGNLLHDFVFNNGHIPSSAFGFFNSAIENDNTFNQLLRSSLFSLITHSFKNIERKLVLADRCLEDMINEAIFDLYRVIDENRVPWNEISLKYLNSIMFHKVLKVIKKVKLRSKVIESPVEIIETYGIPEKPSYMESSALYSPKDGLDSIMLQLETEEEIMFAMKRLNRNERVVFEEIVLNGRSYKQLAEEFGSSEEYLRVVLKRGRDKLKQVLQAIESGESRMYSDEELNEALEHLSPNLRDVYTRIDIDSCSTEQVANELGISIKNVRTRLSRARALMRTFGIY